MAPPQVTSETLGAGPQADVIGQAGNPAPQKTIKVAHFKIEGNTLLHDDDINKVVRRYEGRELTLAQMKALAEDLTTTYQIKGFYLVRAIIPPQPFDSDTVRVTVVEGKIGKVTVEGAKHYSPDYIKARYNLASPDGNFRSEDFTRAMILLNELPDLQVKALMKPGQEVGTADVVLKVQDSSPFHIGVDYNNYGTPATGVNRVGLNIDAGNLATDADLFNVRGVIGFPATQNTFFQAQYQVPVDLNGTTVSVSYANGAFDVSEGLGAILDVRGGADIESITIAHPLERELDMSSNLGLTFAHKAIHNNLLGGAVPFSHDEYTEARLTYQADWREPQGRTLLQASWTQGLGGTPASDPLVSRAGANGGFGKFDLDVIREQNLQTGLYALFRASGQVATSPLYVAEQFAMGGPDTVRGFSQAGLLGDNAYLLSAELRWSPFLSDLQAFQMAFFVDHGGVGENRRLPGDLPYGSSLTGAGFGFRFGMGEHASGRLDLGFPIYPTNLGKTPAVYAGLQTRF